MIVRTHDDAVLVGFCPGSFTRPVSSSACPCCGRRAGVVYGLIGLHVDDREGPASIWVDTAQEEKVDSMLAYNTPAPGILRAKPTHWLFDEWQLVHGPSGELLHIGTYCFEPEAAIEVAEKLGTLGDWLQDWEEMQEDPLMAERVTRIWYSHWLVANGGEAER